MFQYLRNAFTGRISHWNNTHNAALNRLLKRVSELPPSDEFVLKNFAVAACVLFQDIFIPSGRRNFNVDVKDFREEDFLDLYAVVLSYFVFLFGWKEPLFADRLSPLVGKVTDRPERARKAQRLLQNLYAETGDYSPAAFATLVWQELINVDKQDKAIDGGEEITFALFSTTYFRQASEMISRGLGVS